MVKNISGGNKTKRQKRNYGRFDAVDKVENGQMFGEILLNNGDHFNILCSDTVTRIGKMCGSLKKGPRLGVGSYVVVSLREFEAEQKHCDIIAIGAPPNDIINIFKKKKDPKSTRKGEIEFHESDDEFKGLDDSKKIMKKIENKEIKDKSEEVIDIKNKNEDDEDFNWEDL